jgi:hypothetical protein
MQSDYPCALDDAQLELLQAKFAVRDAGLLDEVWIVCFHSDDAAASPSMIMNKSLARPLVRKTVRLLGAVFLALMMKERAFGAEYKGKPY